MDATVASAASDAVIRSGHPRVDFRTDEAKKHTAWMELHLKPFIFPSCTLLDVGCSSGKATFKAEELGAKATGIDCSTQAIQLAREIAQDIGSSAEFVGGNFNSLPFEAAAFDIALFPKNIIECSYGEMAGLGKQLKQVLRRGGVLLLTMGDGLETLGSEEPKCFDKYEISSGRFGSSITVPNAGTYDYPVYFWTVAFATHVVGEHLNHESLVTIDNNHHLLVFRRPPAEDYL